MLSRKYYTMIAECIKNSNGDVNRLVNNLSYEFRCDNYNFDTDRFIKACGIEKEDK